MEKRRPTIRDVAQRAGYSVATVSLVLNDKKVSIPQTTREKIRMAAKELNYRPNQLAVGMITRRTHVLGLIIPDNSNMFYADLSKVIETEARRHGYNLIYGNSNNNSRNDVEYIRMFSDRRVDGVIFVQSMPQDSAGEIELLAAIADSSVPFVTVDRRIAGSTNRAVILNHFKGGYLATRHLIQLGHRRIGCFTGPHSLHSSAERLEGYRSALSEMGLAFDEGLLFEGDYQLGLEQEALDHFAAREVSAVFAFNDLMALGLYRAARRTGLRIPGDLSVVGFDNIPFSDLVDPGLTTIAQPYEVIGSCAVQVLLELMEDREPERQIYQFEPTLIVRGSTRRTKAPAPARPGGQRGGTR